MDEFENLKEYQQQYINTLIREREEPVTFKIGAKLYGIKTSKTFSAEEELKEGSEYEKYNIDKIFRDREVDYKKFVTEICIKRLNKIGVIVSDSDLSIFFKNADIDEIVNLKGVEKRYFRNLDRKLIGLSNENKKEIIEYLKFEPDLLLERTNVFLFYRYWKKGRGDLVNTAKLIGQNCDGYFKTKNIECDHHIVLDYFKNDIIDQLFREIRSNVPYTGFNSFVKMSAGIPRHLLMILKHIYRWSSFNNESPFGVNKKISSSAQLNGIKDAGNWFLEDARIACDDERKIRKSFDRIGRFLQEIRFSDLPPECSISSFSLPLSTLSTNAQKTIEFLEQYSYFIRVNERRDKNSNRKYVTLQINGIIAPILELSIQRRGVIQLNENEIKAIFELDKEEEFSKVLLARLSKYNAPFQQDTLKLF